MQLTFPEVSVSMQGWYSEEATNLIAQINPAQVPCRKQLKEAETMY